MRQSLLSTTCLVAGLAFTLLQVAQISRADYGTPEPGGGNLDAQLQARSLEMVNELSNRRRLHLLFANPQSSTLGVQKSFVNVGAGNLSFIQRDLVRVSHIPLLAGRVYDSRITEGADFGPGWKLAMDEVILRQPGSALVYTDANNSSWRLIARGNDLEFEEPQPPGRVKVARKGQAITLDDGHLVRSFSRSGERYLLSRIEDRHGNTLDYVREDDSLVSIRTSQGRFIAIERAADGRILAISDDAGQRVDYTYTPEGLLASSSLMSGDMLQYRYDASGRLAGIIDPRGVSVLTAGFDGQGRASEVSVLGIPYRFRYEPGRTIVSDVRDVTSTFEQDAAGVTVAVTDNTGAVTKLVLDGRKGRPSAFEVNGVQLATFNYGIKGALARITRSGADSHSETVFSHAPSGALQAIQTDGTELARFGYDRHGRLDSVSGQQPVIQSIRWNDAGQPENIQFEGAVIGIGSDDHGRVTRFSRGYGQTLRFGYDERDRLREINRGAAGSAAYTYGNDKFRTSSIYDGADVVVYSYDAAGNVRGFAYENADGSSREDEYIVGERNELQRVVSSHNPEFRFEYDSLGRATRVLAAERELQIEYDEQSRVTRTTLDGRVTMEADYAQNAFDVAHHEDNRTFRSRATQRPGSGIIGSIHEIVYTRPLYTPWDAVAFDAEMNRFVLRPVTDAHPERLLFDGFARRNLPLTPENSHGAITHLDKPSSSLFVPPELVSANCFVCNNVIFGHVLIINNEFLNPVVLSPGELAIFQSSAYSSGCQYETGPPATHLHALYYDDGGFAGGYTIPPFYANAHAYASEGAYEPFATMKCTCGTFGISWASADVYVCQRPPDSLALSTASGWPGLEPFERGATFYCNSNGALADKFRDSFGQFYSGFTPTEDPCAVSLSHLGNGITGAIHSHPYFYNSSQYHAGIGCFEDQSYISPAELTALNNANKNFSTCPTCDPLWSSTTQTPLYLKTPTGSQVKRRNVNGSVTVIFP